MESDKTVKGVVVTGVIGEDVHNIGISILEHALTQTGFKVVSLGIHTTQEEFVDAAIETKANALFISSLSGHAGMMCSGLRDKCIEAGLKDIILYLGGKLVIGEPPWQETETVFKDLGFDRVYPPGVMPKPVLADLEADLASKGG